MEQKKKLKRHMFGLQEKIIKDQHLYEKVQGCPLNEAQVGLFTTIMREASENYLISYLNVLIHSILKVEDQFGRYL